MMESQDSAAGLIAIAGEKFWAARLAELRQRMEGGQRSARALAQKHVIELTLDRRRTNSGAAERLLLVLAAEAARVHRKLPREGRARMRAALRAGLSGEESLIGFFHILRTATLQAARGFAVQYAGFAEEAPFDLLITRDGVAAEIACDVVSAEDGRDVHRGAWVRLVDAVDPDLQTWLAAHPGRYLLKLTLPQGLRRETDTLASLHGRIRTMLSDRRRADHDSAAVLRLDPLMLAASQWDDRSEESGLVSSLRAEFGHEAHLAVTQAGGGVFVLAARAGREDEVAAAIGRRLALLTPTRLSGTRPGILSIFVEDTDQREWQHLRDRLELEGHTRKFLAHAEARRVIAVTCASRRELFGTADAAEGGDIRFRNPAHPQAKAAALLPAVMSSV
jgi:hypothetical protein